MAGEIQFVVTLGFTVLSVIVGLWTRAAVAEMEVRITQSMAAKYVTREECRLHERLRIQKE